MEKYYEELERIESNKFDIVKLYLLSSINMSGENKEENWKMVNYCYDVWLDANIDLSLTRLAEKVGYYWTEIQNDEMFSEDIIEKCLEY